VDLFDPSLMIFRGGVALNNKEFILEPIRRLVPKYAVNRVPSFAITHLGDSVGLLGALALNFEE
jgi:glucokinase